MRLPLWSSSKGDSSVFQGEGVSRFVGPGNLGFEPRVGPTEGLSTHTGSLLQGIFSQALLLYRTNQYICVLLSYCCCNAYDNTCLLSQVLEIRMLQIKVSAVPCSFWRLSESIHFFAFPASRSCLHSLACGLFVTNVK